MNSISLKAEAKREKINQISELNRITNIVLERKKDHNTIEWDFWRVARNCLSQVMQGVISNVLRPVPNAILNQFTTVKEAKQFFTDHYNIDPFIIRWGSTMLVFDRAGMAPGVKKLNLLVSEGSLKPEPADVVNYISSNPQNRAALLKSFSTHPLLVWMDDKAFLFDLMNNPSHPGFYCPASLEAYLNLFYALDNTNGWL